MGLSLSLAQYLSKQHIDYDTLVHQRTSTALETADKAHIPADSLAKAILLRDQTGYLMAVIPASNKLEVGTLRTLTQRNFEIAPEGDLPALFRDCDLGALPALADAYGIPCIWEDDLAAHREIYLEGGDHESLLQISGNDFQRLMRRSEHAHISHPW